MILEQFKNHIESFPEGTMFKFGISEPFSWRGSYCEVAFAIIKAPMTRERVLERIEEAYTNTFEGYKGGSYTYDNETKVNFEEDYSCWSDDKYVLNMIAEIEGSEYVSSLQEKLVKSIFNKERKFSLEEINKRTGALIKEMSQEELNNFSNRCKEVIKNLNTENLL